MFVIESHKTTVSIPKLHKLCVTSHKFIKFEGNKGKEHPKMEKVKVKGKKLGV
jgi:hypothetical protein